MRVVCCTMYSPSHYALADVSVPNLQEYCDIHGYHMKLINIEDDKWEYKKHEAFEKGFKWMGDGDIIWYKDVDTIITDMRKPITDFVDDYYSFYLTMDANELNGGSVIIKNTEVGRGFNDLVLAQRDMFQNEQNVYNSFPMLTCGVDLMKILPHPSINSYDYSIYPEYPNIRSREQGHWHEGDFVLHTPGAPMEVRLNTLKNAKIIR